MASIQTGIELQDNFTSVIYSIIGSVNEAIYAAEDLQSTMNGSITTSPYDEIQADVEQVANNLNEATIQQENFNQEVDEATEGMGGLESAVQKVVAAIGGMFAIQKVVGFINDCTDAADTQNAAQTQLATTLANMGGTKEDYDALVEKAQEIQKAGMYGDEALIGAAAEFSTYMSDDTAIEMMMDTLTNYAAGMSGGGAVDYDSMVNYATNLGKITTGAYDAMTKKGFEFTDAQKAVIDGTATESQYIEALGEDWQSMSEDMRSAQIISDIINESWSGLYNTMSNTPEGQLISLKNAFGDIQEEVGNELYPILGELYSVIIDNLPLIESVMMGVGDGLGVIITVLSLILQGASAVASFVQANWPMISPIIYGIAGALAVYYGWQLLSAAANGIMAAAQWVLNAAMGACPVTWLILAIAALIAVVIAVANYIAQMGGTATTAFGVICGGVNVVIQFFKNLFLSVANIALGIGNAIGALASNIMTAFYNAICSVQAWWYDLLSTVLTVVSAICEKLNALPFVSFDYSGITQAADDYAAKSAEAAGNKEDYKSISDAFNEGNTTFDTFQDGWVQDAYDSGANWGDGVSDTISDLFQTPETEDYTKGLDSIFDNSFDNSLNNTGVSDNLDNIACDTGNISDAMEITSEDLKYLRDIAEQETVNRFTTAEVKIDMSGMQNHVSNGMDLDGFMSDLTDAVNDAVDDITEGVHE